ncbi:CvpA family protein [Acidithiobacillus sp. GGI-221]|nr:CvpA family protein [Acidithiobacillus sp. GGI-221]
MILWVDAATVGLVVLSALWGLFRGMVREFFPWRHGSVGFMWPGTGAAVGWRPSCLRRSLWTGECR